MAEAAPPWDCTILDCPICFKKYRTPRTLPCLHTFCEECLDIYIKAQVTNECDILCPVCRGSTTLTESKAKVEKLAASFPLNHMIVSMMDSGQRKLDVNTLCDLCKNDSEETPAEFWCEDCCSALCKLCQKVHNRIPTLANHVTSLLQEANKSQTAARLQHIDENCPLHAGKTVEVYCSDHGQLCCVVCFVTKHRECKQIGDIDDIAKETKKSVFSTFINNLKDVVGKLDKIAVNKDENMTRVDAENETTVREMEGTVEQAKQHLDKLLSVFRDEVSRAHARCHGSLATSKKEVQAFIKNANNAQKLLQTVMDSSSQRQNFITHEKLRSQVVSHYENLKNVLADDQEQSLQVDSALKKYIDNMTSLGTVETIQKSSETSRRLISSVSEIIDKINSPDFSSDAQTPVLDLLSASVSLVKVVKKSDLGAICWLTGGTFLKNGNLLLVDTDNHRLMELDDKWSLVKEHKVVNDPLTVSRIDEDNIVMSFHLKKIIYHFEIKSSLTLVNTIPLQRDVWGVAVCDSNIVVAGGDGKTVTVQSQHGDVIKTLADCKSCCAHAATSEKLKTVYHSSEDTIVCRDLQGETVFTYSHPQLKEPRGIGLDAYDNVYVCGMNSRNLHQISADGQRSRILIEKFDSIVRPYCVVVHSTKNIIVVTSSNFSTETTAFEVYRLE